MRNYSRGKYDETSIGKRPFLADGYDPTDPNEIYVDSRLIRWMLSEGMYPSKATAIVHYIYWSICIDSRHEKKFFKSQKKIAKDLGVSENAVAQAVKRTNLFYRVGSNGQRRRIWALGPRPKHEPESISEQEIEQPKEELTPNSHPKTETILTETNKPKQTTPYLDRINDKIKIESIPLMLTTIGVLCTIALLNYKGIEHGQHHIAKILKEMSQEDLKYCKSVNLIADKYTTNLSMGDWVTMFPVFANIETIKLKEENRHRNGIEQCIADLQLVS